MKLCRSCHNSGVGPCRFENHLRKVSQGQCEACGRDTECADCSEVRLRPMIGQVIADTYGEPEGKYLYFGEHVLGNRTIERVLEILSAYPSQSLAFQRMAARADFSICTIAFGFSDPSHGDWMPYLRLRFDEVLSLSNENLEKRVEAACEQATKRPRV